MTNKLTEKQKSFCNEYLIDFNATRAYKAVYTSCKKDGTARTNSSKLLTNTNIQEYIREQQEDMQQRTKVTQEKVINELAKIAFGDIRKLYTETGSLKNINDLDDDTASTLAGIETYQEFDGRGDDREYIGDTKKVKLLDKTKALELLGKHLGIFTEKIKVEQEKPFEVNITVKKK